MYMGVVCKGRQRLGLHDICVIVLAVEGAWVGDIIKRRFVLAGTVVAAAGVKVEAQA
jgi:hypothetical protein